MSAWIRRRDGDFDMVMEWEWVDLEFDWESFESETVLSDYDSKGSF